MRRRQRQEETGGGGWPAARGGTGTKAHLRICSSSAGPRALGCHGTAAGHGSVRGDTGWGRLSTGGCWVAEAGWRPPGPEGPLVMGAHTPSPLPLRAFPQMIRAPDPHQYPVSAFGPGLGESIAGPGLAQGEAWQHDEPWGRERYESKRAWPWRTVGRGGPTRGLVQPQSEESWDAILALG